MDRKEKDKSFEVWKIIETGEIDNRYNTSRIDRWKLVLDKNFSNEKDAKTYIKEQTRSNPSTTGFVAPQLINMKSDKEKDEFLNSFCFPNYNNDSCKYDFYRRYYIGKPSNKFIKNIIKAAGIRHEQ